MSDLKPCPFCQRNPVTWDSDCYYGLKCAGCKLCACQPYVMAQTTAEAVSLWNKRAPENTRATEDRLAKDLAEAVDLLQTSHRMVDTDEHREAVEAFFVRIAAQEKTL